MRLFHPEAEEPSVPPETFLLRPIDPVVELLAAELQSVAAEQLAAAEQSFAAAEPQLAAAAAAVVLLLAVAKTAAVVVVAVVQPNVVALLAVFAAAQLVSAAELHVAVFGLLLAAELFAVDLQFVAGAFVPQDFAVQ